MLAFLPSRRALFGGVALMGKRSATEADFNAYIATLAADGALGWGSSVGVATKAFRTTAAAETGTMTGTSWGAAPALSVFRDNSAPCRVIQHGLPSYAVFTALIARSGQVFFRIVANAASSQSSADRNSYTSFSGGTNDVVTCSEIRYWDPSQPAGQEARVTYPSTGVAPVSFTLPGF